MRQLLLGGARSGKSALAERLAEASGKQLFYVATALAGDGEMSARVAHHQARRSAHWRLVEEPLQLARVLRELDHEQHCVLVDCLTLWVTNALLAPDDALWCALKDEFLQVVEQFKGELLLVSNETGLGVVPMGALSRRFVDESGWLHQALAARCDRVALCVAGLPMVLKGEPLV